MFKIKTFFAIACSLFAALVFAADTQPISQQALLTALKAPEHNIVILDVRSEGQFLNFLAYCKIMAFSFSPQDFAAFI